jgi:hypothetical protein
VNCRFAVTRAILEKSIAVLNPAPPSAINDFPANFMLVVSAIFVSFFSKWETRCMSSIAREGEVGRAAPHPASPD